MNGPLDDEKLKKRRLTLASVNATEEIGSNGEFKMHSINFSFLKAIFIRLMSEVLALTC